MHTHIFRSILIRLSKSYVDCRNLRLNDVWYMTDLREICLDSANISYRWNILYFCIICTVVTMVTNG